LKNYFRPRYASEREIQSQIQSEFSIMPSRQGAQREKNFESKTFPRLRLGGWA
jgi:hypothetical protein